MPWFEMTEREARKWAAQRQLGQAKFIVRYGLGWGAVMFTAFAALQIVSGGFDRLWLGLNLLLWAVGGLVFGFATWHISEGLHRRHVMAQHDVS